MVAEAASKNILDEVRETLERAREELGASSCTFYVRDPFWPDEMLRLVAMPGVRLKEPMHGFSFPPHSKKVLVEGLWAIFSHSSRDEAALRENVETPLDGIPADKRFLFGDFIEREGIVSSARVWYPDPAGKKGIPEAVLFVNYSEARTFDENLQGDIKGLLWRLAAHLPAIRDEMRVSEMDAVMQAIRIFPPDYADSAAGVGDHEQQLAKYLASLLKLAVEVLGLDPVTTFGTVHLYEAQTQTLTLAAWYGGIADMGGARRPLSVPTGDGIISWVAIRRKAVLISDIESSEFRRIHIPINVGVRSEVAIPIFHGETLLGVLNLESYLPDAFPKTCVRSLWFAVNRVAEAVMSKQANVNRRLSKLSSGLLNLCAEAVDTAGVGHFSLNQLAELAAEELGAARCDIWRYNADELTFELSGISPREFDPKPPRPDGFSRGIQRLGWAVWIDIKEAGAEHSVRYWNNEKGWDQPPADRGLPVAVNPSVEPGIKSLLGIPIKVRKQHTGIAWLEYRSSPEAHTEEELMKLANGFAAYAGLVIEFSQVDIVEEKDVRAIGDQLTEQLLAPGSLDLEGFPNIEVFVKSRNHGQSRIGGDFFLARVIDEQTAGVLFGDAEGHGVRGALNMLPMLSVFESFWKESRSVTHIMDKIMGASKKLGVRGSAVYCVFNVMGQNLWLSVTSAGHHPLAGPPLIYFPKEGWPKAFPEQDSPACGGPLGIAHLRAPLAEARMRLSGGDVIIIYTDGLELKFNEVMDISKPNGRPPAAVAEEVFEAARRKSGGAPFDDDATVMVISVKERADAERA